MIALPICLDAGKDDGNEDRGEKKEGRVFFLCLIGCRGRGGKGDGGVLSPSGPTIYFLEYF